MATLRRNEGLQSPFHPSVTQNSHTYLSYKIRSLFGYAPVVQLKDRKIWLPFNSRCWHLSFMNSMAYAMRVATIRSLSEI